jgi:hypothetical protein
MRFDQESRILWTDGGRFLKRVVCPLEKRWSELKPVDGDERRRICGSCAKQVINLEGVSDAEAEQLMEDDGDTCVMIPFGAANITIYGRVPPLMERSKASCPLRVIRTARGLEAIRSQTTPTLRPFLVEVPESEGIQMSVWQHQKTGEVVIETDMRFTPLSDCPAEDRDSWKMVLGWNRYSLGHQAGSDDIPIAAYMIPSDLKPGELVLVEDTIEVVASSINISQGGVSGYRSAPAMWTGRGFKFSVPPPSECIG